MNGKNTGYEYLDVELCAEVTNDGNTILVWGSPQTVIEELLRLRDKGYNFTVKVTDCYL